MASTLSLDMSQPWWMVFTLETCLMKGRYHNDVPNIFGFPAHRWESAQFCWPSIMNRCMNEILQSSTTPCMRGRNCNKEVYVCIGIVTILEGRDRTDIGSGRSFGAINRPKLRQNRLPPNFQDPVDSAESVKARASALNRSFGQLY